MHTTIRQILFNSQYHWRNVNNCHLLPNKEHFQPGCNPRSSDLVILSPKMSDLYRPMVSYNDTITINYLSILAGQEINS